MTPGRDTTTQATQHQTVQGVRDRPVALNSLVTATISVLFSALRTLTMKLPENRLTSLSRPRHALTICHVANLVSVLSRLNIFSCVCISSYDAYSANT